MTYKKSLFRLRDAEVGRSNRLAPINPRLQQIHQLIINRFKILVKFKCKSHCYVS